MSLWCTDLFLGISHHVEGEQGSGETGLWKKPIDRETGNFCMQATHSRQSLHKESQCCTNRREDMGYVSDLERKGQGPPGPEPWSGCRSPAQSSPVLNACCLNSKKKGLHFYCLRMCPWCNSVLNNKNLGVSVGASRTLVHTNLVLRSLAFSGTYISHKSQVLCSPPSQTTLNHMSNQSKQL